MKSAAQHPNNEVDVKSGPWDLWNWSAQTAVHLLGQPRAENRAEARTGMVIDGAHKRIPILSHGLGEFEEAPEELLGGAERDA